LGISVGDVTARVLAYVRRKATSSALRAWEIKVGRDVIPTYVKYLTVCRCYIVFSTGFLGAMEINARKTRFTLSEPGKYARTSSANITVP